MEAMGTNLETGAQIVVNEPWSLSEKQNVIIYDYIYITLLL